MADRNSPPLPRNQRDNPQPEPDADSFAYDRNAVAEDPLVELARIVSETGRVEPDFAAAPQIPVPPAPSRPNFDDDLAGGLEAELMAELRPGYEDRTVTEPYPESAPVEPAAEQTAAFYSNEQYVEQPVAIPAAPYEDTVRQTEPAPSVDAPSFGSPGVVANSGALGPRSSFSLGRDTGFRSAPQAADPYPVQSDPYAAQGVEPDYANTAFSDAELQVSHASHVGNFDAEYAAHEQPSSDVDDMGWPAAEAAISDAPEVFTGHEEHQSSAAENVNRDFDDIFEPEAEFAPGVSAEHVLPPHSQGERTMVPGGGGSKRGLIVAGSVIGVVVLGSAGFLLSGLFGENGPSGPAEVIVADAGPFKVFPTEQRPEAAVPSKAIYDRVGGVAAPRKEQLVPREEAPVASVPTTSGSQPRLVTGNSTDEQQQAQAPTTPNGLPRRVRTVVVRPDGTIINAPAAAQEPEAVQTLPSSVTIPRVAVAPDVSVTTPGAVEVTTPAGSGQISALPNNPAAAASTGPTLLTPRPKPAVPAGQDFATAPVVAPSQASPANSPLDLSSNGQRVAAVQPPPAAVPSAPVASSTGNATATSGSIPTGTYVVQISSQRSREQAEASYSAMQRRYPSVLGDVPSVIQTADLGDKGIYYRVRIVSDSRDTANRLCEDLKSAGGDCFVRRTQ